MSKKIFRRFISFGGRLSRAAFCWSAMAALLVFLVLFVFLETMVSRGATWILYPPFFWAMAALAVKRLHDRGQSAWRLLLLVIPIVGPLWISLGLVFGRGTPGENQYGDDPRDFGADYLRVDIGNPGGAK